MSKKYVTVLLCSCLMLTACGSNETATYNNQEETEMSLSKEQEADSKSSLRFSKKYLPDYLEIDTDICPQRYNSISDTDDSITYNFDTLDDLNAYCELYLKELEKEGFEVNHYKTDSNNTYYEVGDILTGALISISSQEPFFMLISYSTENDTYANDEETPEEWTYFGEYKNLPMPDSCVIGIDLISIEHDNYTYSLSDSNNEEDALSNYQAYFLVLQGCGFDIEENEELGLHEIKEDSKTIAFMGTGNDPEYGYFLTLGLN